MGQLEGRDIILFSLKPWDSSIGSSSKKYAQVFASRGNRVLFVNRALDRMSAIKFRNDPKTRNRLNSLKGNQESLTKVSHNIWTLDPETVLESINKIPWAGVYDWFNKLNNKRLAKQINQATEKLGFSNILLYVENDFIRAQYLNTLIKKINCTIYYIRDYLPSQSYFKTHGRRLEPMMIRKSDLVITNSVYLEKYAREYNVNSFFVGQGCDIKLFSGLPQADPIDMENISGKIIGYTGALLTTRLDIALISKIAETFPDVTIVLVGPEDADFKTSQLHSMKNVVFLGHKKLEELPKYIAKFDICMNPQVVNSMTVGNYPLKIDEYLAMGKKTVATRTEAMEMFSDYVLLAASTQEWMSQIKYALNESSTQEEINGRIAFARTHTWENCVTKLEQQLVKIETTL